MTKELLQHKPIVQKIMDMARRFRNAGLSTDYDARYTELQDAIYEALAQQEQPAQEHGGRESLESLLSTAIGTIMSCKDRIGYKENSVVDKFVKECAERPKDWPGTATTQPAQEPYGWVRPNPGFNSGLCNIGAVCPTGWIGSATPVYAHPAPTQPSLNAEDKFAHTDSIATADDAAVDAFAREMKAKLARARAKGRTGWQLCSQEELSHMLHEHVEKGDPRDVANFCMFLHSLGHGIVQRDAINGCYVAQPEAHYRGGTK